MSQNKVARGSCISIFQPSAGSIDFSSFRNNSATQSVAIQYMSGVAHNMNHNNIIENNQNLENSDRIICAFSQASIIMEHCSIFNNQLKERVLFCRFKYTMNVKIVPLKTAKVVSLITQKIQKLSLLIASYILKNNQSRNFFKCLN